MRRLLLLRHANASAKQAGAGDRDRRLDKQGHAEAIWAGDTMRQATLCPDIVLVSPSCRTLETLDALRPFLSEPKVRVCDDLYLAEAETLAERIRELDDAVHTALVIAHNPGLLDLAFACVGDEKSEASRSVVRGDFPTGAFVEIDIATEWGQFALGRRCGHGILNFWAHRSH